MSNRTFAGPFPDSNLTLSQVDDTISRLKLLGMDAVLVVVAPTQSAFSAMSDYFNEQDLIDLGVDRDSDPVLASLRITNEGLVISDPSPYQWGHLQTAAAIKRRLDRGGLADLNTIIWSVFGWQADAKTITAQIVAQLPEGKSLTQTMQGK